MNQAYMTIPKVLFTDSRYAKLNADAILLYSALVDRLSLSRKNGKQWQDGKTGETFIYYTRKAMCSLLKRSEPYVRKILALLRECGLIKERRQGLTRPNVIVPVVLEGDVRSGGNIADVPERNEVSRNEPKKNHSYTERVQQRPYTPPARGNYPKKPRNTGVLAQQYTQCEYSREELMTLCTEI